MKSKILNNLFLTLILFSDIVLPFHIHSPITTKQPSMSRNKLNFSPSNEYRMSERNILFSSKDQNKGENSESIWDGIIKLWDEIIEVSTYGPSERKMLKAQRERLQKKSLSNTEGNEFNENKLEDVLDIDDDRAWMESFAAVANEDKGNTNVESMQSLDYDGYALQDLLVSKWGASLDVDFQLIGDKIYCTVLPLLGFGSPLRSRHDSELDYLMHLQGVIEILHKYDNLNGFIHFIESTTKVPKRGTDSVPFRLNLSTEEIETIIQK